MRSIRRTIAGIGCAALAVAFAVPAASAAVAKDQQNCINRINKDGAKVAAVQGKENAACIKNAGKGKLPPGQSADACLNADGKGKVDKAIGKTTADFAARCAAAPPSFGIPAGSAAAVNAAATGQSLALLADLFGAPLAPAVLSCETSKDDCNCQRIVAKSYEKLAATALKQFVKCKKGALKEGKSPVPAGAESAAELQLCVDDAGTPESIAGDGKQKIAKKVDKLGQAIDKKCAAGDSRETFPGVCAGLAGGALRDCIARRVDCRVCLTINAMDDLAVDCDVFDDAESNGSCGANVVGETIDIPSGAEPADTPGTTGVVVTNANLVTQFGGSSFSLNNARYTRFHDGNPASDAGAILILVPGFEGGGNNFKLLAESLIPRAAAAHGLVLEVWAYDRRSNQLEDVAGLEIAEAFLDPLIAMDWLYGDALALPLHPELAAGPNRRALFHNESSDIPFLANWTPLVFSRDIDAIVEQASAVTANVFLGGHSAGTGFTARYAATDFDLSGGGPAEAGYAKLRGLVLLEGGGGSFAGAPSSDTLDRIEDKFDGGLFGAVRDQAPRCADGTTPCTIASEAVDCAGIGNARCTEPTTAYSIIPNLLNPQILASGDVIAIQAATDPDSGQGILRADQGAPGNNALAMVPELSILSAFLPNGTAQGLLGSFIDDDGTIAGFASFVATSVGAVGPVVGGLTTWLDNTETLPAAALPNNGPAPTALPAGRWGQEKELTNFDRMITTFYVGESNFTDWYYPSSGLALTSVSGVCDVGGSDTCTVGDVGAPCTANSQCSQSLGLDSSPLSVGRGRRDIENMTQAANVDIPVIAFGGSNGLAPVPGNFVTYAQTLAPCAAPSCDGTPRVVDASTPSQAFPTFGGADGGFEVHITEGAAHLDVLTADDSADNEVLAPLADFLARNSQ
jgi:pimeloyl-ACP methyl ester carboxylesterase